MPCANDQLSDAQKAIMKKIVDAGRALGMPESDIELAVQVAFQESSLGRDMGAPYAGSTSSGLYQYNNGTWGDRHAGMDHSSIDDNIFAYYADLVDLHGRFDAGVNDGQIPAGMAFEEYAYIRHHDGWYAGLNNAPGADLYDNFLNFCLSEIPVIPPASGTGGGYVPDYSGGEDYSWVYGWINDHPVRHGISWVTEPVQTEVWP